MCDMYCEYGFEKGEDGCPVCICNVYPLPDHDWILHLYITWFTIKPYKLRAMFFVVGTWIHLERFEKPPRFGFFTWAVIVLPADDLLYPPFSIFRANCYRLTSDSLPVSTIDKKFSRLGLAFIIFTWNCVENSQALGVGFRCDQNNDDANIQILVAYVRLKNGFQTDGGRSLRALHNFLNPLVKLALHKLFIGFVFKGTKTDPSSFGFFQGD